MKNFISFCALLIVTFMFGNVSAEVYEQNFADDMFAHPKNYFYVGIGASSTGDSIYAIKSSVNVKKYAPPNYIISIDRVQFWPVYEPVRKKPSATFANTVIFHYDYKNKKIFIEVDENKLNEINLNDANNDSRRSQKSYIFLAEIAFYLAYNQSFFDKPLTDLMQKYIDGNGVFFNPNE